jgi:hypothetical protein
VCGESISCNPRWKKDESAGVKISKDTKIHQTSSATGIGLFGFLVARSVKRILLSFSSEEERKKTKFLFLNQ